MPGQPGRSGGRRRGRSGRQYPNRSDLRQPAQAAPNQEYGKAGAQIASQQQQPLPTAGGAAPSALAGMMGGGGAPPIPLNAPTQRPNEPLTSGLPGGPGPGPEALNLPPSEDENILAVLKGLYQAYPNSDLARLIANLDNR